MIAQNTRILWLPGEDRHFDYESGGWSGGGRNPAGVRIDPETALRSTVVLACVRVLSSSVAGLPLHLYRRLPSGGKELARENPLYRVLHDRPNSWQSSYEWREQIMLHLLTHGQAFVEISGSGPQTQLVALHPSRMKVEQIENGRLRYTYREASGGSTVYAQDAIMHLRWLSDDGVNGMVPVELAKDAIGLARACEIHGASFFANGARPGIVLSTDQTLSPEAAMNTRDQWERAHRGPDRAHKTAVLQGGLKVNELGGNNQEAQFLEARRFQVEEVCRIYGVPPHLVGDLSRSSFSNIEQQSLDYVQNGLMPWLRRIESAIARDLVDDEELFAEFDVRGALRADAAGRASYYNAMWNLGVLSVNEIRAAENLNPVEGGDTRFVQLNMQTLDKAVTQPDPVVEEVVAEPAPEEPVAADAPTVLEVLDQYRTGALTVDGAKALLVVAFPETPEAQIDAILAGVVKKEPEPVEPEARTCGANAAGGGGFQKGNTCGKGGGGGAGDSDAGSGVAAVREYREAKTREEAEQVASQYAKKVSYRGVDVDSANRINKAVDEFFQQHPDMPQLESIEAKKFTGTSSTGNEDAAASYHMLSHKMQVNTAIMGSQKKWDEYTRKGKEAESIVAKALAEGRLQGRQKEIAEQHLSRGSLVDDSFRGAITHELGHHFDAKVLMKMPISDRKALMDRRPQFESRLSGYASTNAFEYFAESYVAYRVGRTEDIDPELRAIFDKRSGKK